MRPPRVLALSLVLYFGSQLAAQLALGQEAIPNEPPRYWVCLHWAHPEHEWISTLISDSDPNEDGLTHWEYLEEKYPGSYKGKCKETT